METRETISGNLIELHEEDEEYATVHLKMPHPINEIVFTFTSEIDAEAFIDALQYAAFISSPLTHHEE